MTITNLEIKMLIDQLLKAKLEDKLVAVFRKMYGVREEEELDELSSGVLDRYIDKSQHQLRKGTYGSAHDFLRDKLRKRTNRLWGVKQANTKIKKRDDDEDSEYQRSANED